MKCVLKPALLPVLASRKLLSAPLAVQKAVNVTLASSSTDRRVSTKLNVAAMKMEKHTKYSSATLSVNLHKTIVIKMS